MLNQITYDRSERCYKWPDPDSGEIFRFQPGPQGKAQAFQFAVGMLDPDLYNAAQRVITRHPQLERTVWRAVELVATDQVEVFAMPTEMGIIGMVGSSDGAGRYAVGNDNGYSSCQCHSFTEMTAPLMPSGQTMCKHILAVKLWQVTREDRF